MNQTFQCHHRNMESYDCINMIIRETETVFANFDTCNGNGMTMAKKRWYATEWAHEQMSDPHSVCM